MKSTGIVRKLDDLGRIVLPIELRRTLDIADKAPLEIFVEGDSIILRKYEPSCVFCGKSERKKVKKVLLFPAYNAILIPIKQIKQKEKRKCDGRRYRMAYPR